MQGARRSRLLYPRDPRSSLVVDEAEQQRRENRDLKDHLGRREFLAR